MKKEFIDFVGHTVLASAQKEIDKDGKFKSLSPVSSYFKVSEDLFKNNLKKFVATMNRVLKDADFENDAYAIDEIDFNIEVNMDGDIKIISGGIKSGITIKLKRNN